jgi:hypothetical protein
MSARPPAVVALGVLFNNTRNTTRTLRLALLAGAHGEHRGP